MSSTIESQQVPANGREAPAESSVAARGLIRSGLDWLLPRLAGLYTSASTRRRGLLAASVVRIGYGLVLIGLLLNNLPLLNQLWGPDGEYSFTTFLTSLHREHSFSLYALSGSAFYSGALYLGTLALSVLFVLGWRTRIISPVLWLLVFSWGTRNPTVLDGGDNILDIMLVYLCLMQTSAYLSLDARRKRRQGKPDPTVDTGTPGRFLGTLLHNAGVTLFIFQVCTVYLVAGMNKVQGPDWQNGTAIYYILRISEFNTFPELTRLIYPHAPLDVFITYLTVLLQLSFPFLLFNRVTRHLAFFVAAGMHVGIALLMGLPFFSGVMLISDVMIFADKELYAMRDWAVARFRRRRAPAPARSRQRIPVGSAVSSTAASSMNSVSSSG